jgi:hypothetical protein
MIPTREVHHKIENKWGKKKQKKKEALGGLGVQSE